MLILKGVTKKHGKKVVLDDISAELTKGCYGVLGPNGAGKTTLFRCILEIDRIHQGEIRWDEKEGIGYLPQHLELFGDAKVDEILMFFATMKKIPPNLRENEIDRVLRVVNLYDRKKDKIKKLSGGMKQRVGIAQVLLGDPKVLVFDEPTAGLDPEERSRFKAMVRELGDKKTILISSHIVSDIKEVCDYVILMKKGKILEISSVHPGDLEQYYLRKMQEDDIRC